MADAFTLTMKTGAITRYAARGGFRAAKTVEAYMAEIERQVRLKLPLSEIKGLVINMRGWAWSGPLNEWAWLDGRLDDLAEYLSTPAEQLSNREIAERLELSILSGGAR